MWQRRDFLGQNNPIIGHAACPNLHQLIKVPGYQMHLLELGNPGHGLIERCQSRLAGIAQSHLDERHMILTQPNGIDQRLISFDNSSCFQPLKARLG